MSHSLKNCSDVLHWSPKSIFDTRFVNNIRFDQLNTYDHFRWKQTGKLIFWPEYSNWRRFFLIFQRKIDKKVFVAFSFLELWLWLWCAWPQLFEIAKIVKECKFQTFSDRGSTLLISKYMRHTSKTAKFSKIFSHRYYEKCAPPVAKIHFWHRIRILWVILQF